MPPLPFVELLKREASVVRNATLDSQSSIALKGYHNRVREEPIESTISLVRTRGNREREGDDIALSGV